MKSINWNDMSELGLIRVINTEVLHPLGLVMSRNPDNGNSEVIYISDDGNWEYEQKQETPSREELKAKVQKLIDKKFGHQ